MNPTPHEAAMADILPLIDSLELPYLEALQQMLAEHVAQRRQEYIAEARAKILQIAASVRMSPEALIEGVALRPRAQVDRKPPKPRYRHPETGKTWSGMGAAPAWIRDQDRTQFLIGEEA
jgi:DNA-binding protein H-NS